MFNDDHENSCKWFTKNFAVYLSETQWRENFDSLLMQHSHSSRCYYYKGRFDQGFYGWPTDLFFRFLLLFHLKSIIISSITYINGEWILSQRVKQVHWQGWYNLNRDVACSFGWHFRSVFKVLWALTIPHLATYASTLYSIYDCRFLLLFQVAKFLLEVPLSITVIRAEEIRELAWQTLFCIKNQHDTANESIVDISVADSSIFSESIRNQGAPSSSSAKWQRFSFLLCCVIRIGCDGTKE